MIIEGFDKSKVVSNLEIRDFINETFDSKLIYNVERIGFVDVYKSQLSNQDSLDNLFSKGLYIASSYFLNESTGKAEIEIYRQDPFLNCSKEFILFCLAHEIGHNLYESMSDELKSNWHRIVVTSNRDAFVSARAAANILEDFCECFASYYLSREKLRACCKKKYEFFKSLLLSLLRH